MPSRCSGTEPTSNGGHSRRQGGSTRPVVNKLAADWDSEYATRQTLEIYRALQGNAIAAEVPEGAATYLINYWERAAGLVRAGHLDRSLVYDYMGSRRQWWWTALSPNTRRARVEAADSTIGEHFEWLAGLMARMDSEAKVGVPYDDEHVLSTLDRRIQNAQERLRNAEDLRAVIVRPMSPESALASKPVPRRRAATT